MSDYKFWSAWPKSFRYLYFFLLIIFFSLVAYYLFLYNSGINNIIKWETQTSLQNLKHTISSIDLGLFKLNIPGYSYIIEETFAPKDFSVNIGLAHSYIILVFVCLAIGNTIITSLSRTYFLVGFATIIFSFLMFKFDELGLFGIYENYFVGGFLLIIGVVSYYFHAFKTDLSFFQRLISFIFIYGGILCTCYFFAKEQYPLVSLAQHGLLFGAIVTLVFIVMVSHEILYGFLVLLTYSATPGSKNSLTHFLLVSALYFLCLLLIYLQVMGFSDFELFGTNAFLILPFSAVLGFYGYRAREIIYGNIISFDPLGGFLYIVLGILSFSTLGYFFATYNDPAIEAFQDYIIFSHIGIGLVFFVYIIINFVSLLKQNLSVHKVVFKPQRLPFYFVRLGGLIVAIVLMVRANFLELNQSVAAYMISLGDISLAQKDHTLAKQYYQLSKDYDNYNFRSNYSLAQLALEDKKQDDAIFYLKETFFRQPSPQGFINLSNIYLKNDLYFDAIFSLKEGLKEFPNDGLIYNNLALLYNKTSFIDSAYIYLNFARQYSKDDERVRANYWAFLARNNNLFVEKSDSLLENDLLTTYLPAVNNSLAFANSLNKRNKQTLPATFFEDTVFNNIQFSLLNNYILNRLPVVDSVTSRMLKNRSKLVKESAFGENIRLLEAEQKYYSKDVQRAFKIAENLSKEGITNIGHYNLLLGLWSLENGAGRLAEDYFNKALEKGVRDAFYYKAIAVSESGNNQEAILAWDNVLQLNDPSTNALASSMRGLFTTSKVSEIHDLTDEFRYHLLRFRFKEFTREQRTDFIQNISDEKIRNKALLMSANKFWEEGSYPAANDVINQIITANLKDKEVKSGVDILRFKNSLLSSEITIKEPVSFDASSPYSLFAKAKNFELKGNTKQAEGFYLKSIAALPFDRDVINEAVKFYNNHKNPEAGYNVALEASKLNPYSSDLLKTYILQSLKVNLTTYANDGMEKLKEITSPADYSEFEKRFIAEKALQESSADNWK